MPHEKGWIDFDAPLIEVLALVAGRMNDGEPVGILTARLAPQDSFTPSNALVSQVGLLRLRDDITRLLNDPKSWLYLPEEQQEAIRSLRPDFTG